MSQFVSLFFDSTYFQHVNPILVEGTSWNSHCPPSVRLFSPCLFSFSSVSFFYGSTYCNYYPPTTCSYKRKCTVSKRVYVKKGLGRIWSEYFVAYFKGLSIKEITGETGRKPREDFNRRSP